MVARKGGNRPATRGTKTRFEPQARQSALTLTATTLTATGIHCAPSPNAVFNEVPRRRGVPPRPGGEMDDDVNLEDDGPNGIARGTRVLEEFTRLPEFVLVSTIVSIGSIWPNQYLGVTLFSYFRFLFVTRNNYSVKRQGNLLTKILLSHVFNMRASVHQYIIM